MPGLPELVDGVHPLSPLIHVFTYGMLRVGEGLGLLWQDLDLEARIPTMSVNQQYTKQRLYGPPKTRSSTATVPLSPHLADALKGHRDRMRRARYRATCDANEQVGYDVSRMAPVFPQYDGRVLQRGKLESWWRSHVLPSVDVPPISFHGLRRTGNSLLADAGVPPELRKVFARHRPSSSVNEDRYTAFSAEALHEAITAAGAAEQNITLSVERSWLEAPARGSGKPPAEGGQVLG